MVQYSNPTHVCPLVFLPSFESLDLPNSLRASTFSCATSSALDYKKIQPVHPKGDQSWVFIGRTDTDAETPVLWPPHVKSWFIGKDPNAGKAWGQKEKGTTGDEMAGWHHLLNGHGSGWTLGVGDGQGGLACCSSWGRKESDTTEWLNWTELHLPRLSLPHLFPYQPMSIQVT